MDNIERPRKKEITPKKDDLQSYIVYVQNILHKMKNAENIQFESDKDDVHYDSEWDEFTTEIEAYLLRVSGITSVMAEPDISVTPDLIASENVQISTIHSLLLSNIATYEELREFLLTGQADTVTKEFLSTNTYFKLITSLISNDSLLEESVTILDGELKIETQARKKIVQSKDISDTGNINDFLSLTVSMRKDFGRISSESVMLKYTLQDGLTVTNPHNMAAAKNSLRTSAKL